jgi:ATP-dependent DNA helicase PIF1
MRRKRGSRGLECRFKFPAEHEEESSIRPEDGSWRFFLNRNDPYLQRHDKFVTQVWRAYTDLSPIISKEAVLNYVAKYASKGEHASESYSIILRRVIDRNPVDTSAATLMRQLLISSVAERNYSAQEVQHLLMG